MNSSRILPSTVGAPVGLPTAGVFGRRSDSDSDSSADARSPVSSAFGEPVVISKGRGAAYKQSASVQARVKQLEAEKAKNQQDPWWMKLLLPQGDWTNGYVTEVDQLTESMRAELKVDEMAPKEGPAREVELRAPAEMIPGDQCV
jgi:hypothetical protein